MSTNPIFQLAIWKHALYPGIDVDFKYDNGKTYAQNKATLKKLLPKKSPEVFSLFRPIYRSIEKLVTGHAHLVFVKGPPGSGKTLTVERALKDMGVSYASVNGDVTEAYLYRLLFENKDGILYIKEASKLMRSVRALNLLKNATEFSTQRVITKHNYSHLEVDLPTSFEYNGRLIFDYNDIPNSRFKEDFNALVSRGDFVELLLSRHQFCDLMIAIAKTTEEKEITDFLTKEFPFQDNNIINLRTQARAFATYKFCKENKLDWKKELYEELHNQVNPIVYMLFKIMGTEPMKVMDLKKSLIMRGELNTLRTADRRVQEWITLGQLHRLESKERNYHVRLVKRNA